MRLKALITGVGGQDGAYMAAHLLEQGYEVFGSVRSVKDADLWRLQALGVEKRVHLVPLDLRDAAALKKELGALRPDELYHLAAQSFVAESFKNPVASMEADALGVARLLDAVRCETPETRFFQASTSELFGQADVVPQTEATTFHPRSPYGVAKLAAHWMVINARECFGLFACNGILYNHESPLRGRQFVTRKITADLAEIKKGRKEPLELGNLNARRDWGFAGDVVRGMHLMLRHDKPSDYILATGKTHTVRSFVEQAAAFLELTMVWEGEGVEEIGRDAKTGQVLVKINPSFYRPVDSDVLCGDASKARTVLGWRQDVSFSDLVTRMARADWERQV